MGKNVSALREPATRIDEERMFFCDDKAVLVLLLLLPPLHLVMA